tara:strand:- start:453 stop:632 length:180 start_codon:yes stop_codon:yes gene_type:complete
VLTYPEIRGVLAQLEEEFKGDSPQGFGDQARYVLALVDRRMQMKVKEKSDKIKKEKFFF